MWERGWGHELNFAKEIASYTQKHRLKVTERTPERPEVGSQVSDPRGEEEPLPGWPAIGCGLCSHTHNSYFGPWDSAIKEAEGSVS